MMTNARLMLTAAAVLIAGLLTAGLGVFGYSATRPTDCWPKAQQTPAPQKPATAQSSLRPDGPASTKGSGPVIVEILVVDSQGRGVDGVEVFSTIASAACGRQGTG